MADFIFGPQTAVDVATGDVVRSSGLTGKVYATLADAQAETSPLTVTLPSGLTSTDIPVSSFGQSSLFISTAGLAVYWRSGTYIVLLIAIESLLEGAGKAAWSVNGIFADENHNIDVDLPVGEGGGGETGSGATVTWSTLGGKPDTFPSSPHSHVRAEIEDITVLMRNMLGAVDAATARGIIGAGTGNGTSNLALGSTSTTAAPGNHSHSAAQVPFTAAGGITATNVQQAIQQAATMGGSGGTSDPGYMFERAYTSGAWPVRGVATGRCVWAGPVAAGPPPSGGSYSQPGDKWELTP